MRLMSLVFIFLGAVTSKPTVGACDGSKQAASSKEQAMTQTVQLESVYSTTGQEGLKTFASDGRIARTIQDTFREYRAGASNLFLVHGRDIAEALSATRRVLVGSGTADVAPHPDGDPHLRPKTPPCWLIVVLGYERTGPRWLVDSVQRSGNVIRFTVRYRHVENDERQAAPYFFCVPLGAMRPGRYTIELVNVSQMEVTFMRRVTVSDK